MNADHQDTLNNDNIVHKFCRDMTKLKLVENVANIFNRLVIYTSTKNIHNALDYFGTDINDQRLFHIFFFTTNY